MYSRVCQSRLHLSPVPPPPINFSVVELPNQKCLEWTTGVGDDFDIEGFRIVAEPGSASDELTFFSHEPKLNFSGLKPFTNYTVEVSSCLDKAGKLCGESSFFLITTDVGGECLDLAAQITALPRGHSVTHMSNFQVLALLGCT